MKKIHSPGGTRICTRMLCYSIAFVAILGIRETLKDGTGPVSKKLGVAFNDVLMTTSKMGLGFALMSQDKNGHESTMLGRTSKVLGMAAHRGYVSAAKVDLFSR